MPSVWWGVEAAFGCWATHRVWRCAVVLLGLVIAFGMMQSVRGQDATGTQSAAPSTEVGIGTGSEFEEVAPRFLSTRMVSIEAAPQHPWCLDGPSYIWKQVQEGTTCKVEYACDGAYPIGAYVYLHHVNGTAELGKDVLVTGKDSLEIDHIRDGFGVTSTTVDTYETLSDGIPEGDEVLKCYCGRSRDGPIEGEWYGRFRILDVDGWTVRDTMATEADGFMPFFLEFLQPVARDLTVKYRTEDGTATEGTDYTKWAGRVTIKKGDTSAEIRVPILGDQIPEGAETFKLVTHSDLFAGIPKQSAIGTIVLEPYLVLDPSPLSVKEGCQASYTVALGTQPVIQRSVRDAVLCTKRRCGPGPFAILLYQRKHLFHRTSGLDHAIRGLGSHVYG